MKTIGIAIHSYKYGHLAAHCIESILSQTVMPDKIWLIDDGIGDCKYLIELYPQVNFIIRSKNLGIVDSFQDTLYNIIDTDYIIMIGADNWLASDTIEILQSYIRATPNVDIITYDIIVTGELKKEILNRQDNECSWYNGDIYWDRSSGHHGSMLYNVNRAKKVGGYAAKSETGKTEEDWILYDRILNDNGVRIHVDEAFLFYRRHNCNFNKYD